VAVVCRKKAALSSMAGWEDCTAREWVRAAVAVARMSPRHTMEIRREYFFMMKG
jgi:hypothetical protein